MNDASARVTAYDSGDRVIVELEASDDHPLYLTIGESSEVSLTVEEAERIIDALRVGLERLARLREPRVVD